MHGIIYRHIGRTGLGWIDGQKYPVFRRGKSGSPSPNHNCDLRITAAVMGFWDVGASAGPYGVLCLSIVLGTLKAVQKRMNRPRCRLGRVGKLMWDRKPDGGAHLRHLPNTIE